MFRRFMLFCLNLSSPRRPCQDFVNKNVKQNTISIFIAENHQKGERERQRERERETERETERQRERQRETCAFT